MDDARLTLAPRYAPHDEPVNGRNHSSVNLRVGILVLLTDDTYRKSSLSR